MSELSIHDRLQRGRILLVDDTEINRDVFSRILEAAGFDVDVVPSGEAAYEAAWGRPYDLVLMDVEMPGMNGFETAARMRGREGAMSGVKIAALTATSQPYAEQFSHCSGIDAFIGKPIAPHRLVERVMELIGTAEEAKASWKPVWRSGVFAEFTARLDAGEADGYLKTYAAHLDVLVGALDGALDGEATPDFAFELAQVLEFSTLLGFDEVASVCRDIKVATCADDRSRAPNLLGAIDRAQFAIDKHQRDHQASTLGSLVERTRAGVQSLLRGGGRSAA